jgi:predicted DNA-binding transcriptional regulator AlpA
MNTIDPIKLLDQSDDQLITVQELAALLRTTPSNVYKQSSCMPGSLPPRMTCFGRRLVWRLGTCRDWIRARSPVIVEPPTATPKSRMGRPRQG